MTQRPPPPVRHLGLADATAIYAGVILGSGIFVAPAVVAGAMPSVPAAVAAWIAGAVVAACGACCYAECAARIPANGGFFLFHREAFGPAVAFVGGWAALFVTYPASVAAMALVLAGYAAEAVGLGGYERTTAAAAIAVAAVLNVVGLRTGPRAQIVVTSAKVAALAALALAALAASRPGALPPEVPPAAVAAGTGAWLAAAMILLWTYEGWSDVTLVAGEVKDPARNVGRAVLIGTAVLAAVYALVQVAVMTVLPGGLAAASTRPVAEAVEAVGGPAAGRTVAALVVLSTFGAIHGVVLTVSRLGATMAREGAFLAAVATPHPRWGTPVRSTAVIAGASIAYVVFGTFGDILGYFTFTVWIFYGLTAVGLLVLRRRRVGEPLAWRAPWGIVPPLTVILVGGAMTTRIVLDRPRNALVGAAVLAVAWPVYRWVAARGR